jgi:hypothetical protein
VGVGRETYFWTNPWVGGSSLCVRFRRFFDLAENKSSSVADICQVGWRGWCLAFEETVCGRERRSA